MTREEYIEDIKLSLGAPVIDIEIESTLGLLVDKAFREVKPHITETRFVTVPYDNNSPIDTKPYDISAIVQIFRTSNPSRVADITDVYALSTLNIANSTSSNLLLSDYMYRTQMNQLKSSISTDLDFTFDKEDQKLYINTFYPPPQALTLVYIPEFRDVSEVKEQFWINYIQRLSLAFSKEALGRVRSKYELSRSLYKLDGGDLVSEGITERDAIRQELSDNSDLVFPID